MAAPELLGGTQWPCGSSWARATCPRPALCGQVSQRGPGLRSMAGRPRGQAQLQAAPWGAEGTEVQPLRAIPEGCPWEVTWRSW